MRRLLTAAVLLLALNGMWGAASAVLAQSSTPLPATPRLPSFGKGLFGSKSSDTSTLDPGAGTSKLPGRPTLLRRPASTLEGREATLQALQNCYAREAARVIGAGAAESRVPRLRQLCENEEMADTRAWLKWSKLGDSRQGRRIVNAIQEDDAEKALTSAATPPVPENS